MCKQLAKGSQTPLMTDGEKDLITEGMCLWLQRRRDRECEEQRNNGHAQSAYMTAEEQQGTIPVHVLMDLLRIVAQIYFNSFIFIMIFSKRLSRSGSQHASGALNVRWEYTLQGTPAHYRPSCTFWMSQSYTHRHTRSYTRSHILAWLIPIAACLCKESGVRRQQNSAQTVTVHPVAVLPLF